MAVSLFCLLLSFVASVLATPAVRNIVLRFGLVDAAGRSHRKIHANDVPRLGGIAIVIGFFLPIGIAYALQPGAFSPLFDSDADLAWAFFLGAGAIAALGLYDDTVGTTPKQKFLVQFAVAISLVIAGFRIERIDPPFLRAFDLGWLGYPLTVLWIVGVTNALNLIDGLDGLAAGLSLIAVAPVAVVALADGDVALAIFSFALIGALGGFLVHNFHPARIFMGDTGSMFLGFVLAVVTVQVTQKVSVAASLGAPLFALALPIFDTLSSMARRAIVGRPMFSPDRRHLHHRIMELGLSHRGVVLAMYGGAIAFSGVATALLLHRGPLTGVSLIASGLLTLIVLHKLGYFGRGDRLIESIEGALHLRRRNRAIYASLNAWRRSSTRSPSATDLVAELLHLVRLSGASWARVVIAELELAEEIGNSNTGDVRIEFPIFADGEAIGTLSCAWPKAVDDTVLHVLESARDIVERRIQHFRRAKAFPSRAA